MKKRKTKVCASFRKQMAESMAALEAIMRGREDFCGNGHFEVRRIRKGCRLTACSRPPVKQS